MTWPTFCRTVIVSIRASIPVARGTWTESPFDGTNCIPVALAPAPDGDAHAHSHNAEMMKP